MLQHTSNYQMNPARIIINATLYGALAWAALYFLQLLTFMVEPILNQKLSEIFGFPLIWDPLHKSWYGQVLEMLHPLVIVAAVAYSAAHDFVKMSRSYQKRRNRQIQHHECLKHSHATNLRQCNTGGIAIIVRKSSQFKPIRNHNGDCCRHRNFYS